MGRDYPGQEKAVDQVRHMPDEIKSLLSHHLRNSLSGIIGGLQTERYDLAEQSAWHLKEDLERFGL